MRKLIRVVIFKDLEMLERLKQLEMETMRGAIEEEEEEEEVEEEQVEEPTAEIKVKPLSPVEIERILALDEQVCFFFNYYIFSKFVSL